MEDDNNTASKLIMVPDIAEWEDGDSERAKYTIIMLHNEIDKLKEVCDRYENVLHKIFVCDTECDTEKHNTTVGDLLREKEDYKSRIEKADWYLLESLECLYHGANFTFDELIHNTSDILNGKE